MMAVAGLTEISHASSQRLYHKISARTSEKVLLAHLFVIATTPAAFSAILGENFWRLRITQSTPGSSTVWSGMPSSALLDVTLIVLVDL